jgi:hypothetical protein
VWASDITPVTGKWRIETVEINGPVQIGEVRVAAGDLVVADDTGVCFIPRDVVLEVLDAAEQKAKAEAVRCKAIDDGVPVPDIARATYGEKYAADPTTARAGEGPASHSAGVAATAFCSGRSAAAKIAGERLRAKRKTAMIT